MARYDEFTLTINDDDSLAAELVTYTGAKEPANGQLFSTPGFQSDFISQKVEILRKENLDPNDLDLLGRAMFEALFPEKIGALFEKALSQVLESRYVGEKDRQIRLIIEAKTNSIPAKSGWPLEFLRSNAFGGKWLATERDMITLSRRLVLTQMQPTHPFSTPIQILIIVSRPSDQNTVMAAPTLKLIAEMARSETAGPTFQANLAVKVLGIVEDLEKVAGLEYLRLPATYPNFSEQTIGKEWYPQVIHFVGHGDYTRSKGGLLGFVDENNKADWVRGVEFAENINHDNRPRLVLLQACESAKEETGVGFMSLAAHLVMHNIPAVIAMQFAITNDYATDFAEGFYQALRKGKDVDTAVQWGRWKIANKTRSKEKQFGAPVLFQYDPSGIAFTSSESRNRPELPAIDTGLVGGTSGRPSIGGTGFGKSESMASMSVEEQVIKNLGDAMKKLDQNDVKMADVYIGMAIRKLQSDYPDLAAALENVIQDSDDVSSRQEMIAIVLDRLKESSGKSLPTVKKAGGDSLSSQGLPAAPNVPGGSVPPAPPKKN